MLKKAFKHWQRYWWIYMLAMTILVGGAVAGACAIYPPLIPLIAAAVVIKGTAILSFLTSLSGWVAIAATGSVAAGATMGLFIGLRSITALGEMFVLSIKNCFSANPNMGKSADRLPHKSGTELNQDELLEQMHTKLVHLNSAYRDLLNNVSAFNQQYPELAINLTEYQKVSLPRDCLTKPYDDQAQLFDKLKGLYDSLKDQYTIGQGRAKQALHNKDKEEQALDAWFVTSRQSRRQGGSSNPFSRGSSYQGSGNPFAASSSSTNPFEEEFGSDTELGF